MDTHRSDVRSRRRSHSGQLLWQRPLGEPRATDRLGRLRAALCRRATLASRGLDSNFQFPAEIGFGFSRLRRLSAGVKVFAFHRNHPFCARAPEGANASRRGADRGTGRGNLERDLSGQTLYRRRLCRVDRPAGGACSYQAEDRNSTPRFAVLEVRIAELGCGLLATIFLSGFALRRL